MTGRRNVVWSVLTPVEAVLMSDQSVLASSVVSHGVPAHAKVEPGGCVGVGAGRVVKHVHAVVAMEEDV